MITTILFDLDGTLLPMDQELFVKSYLKRLAAFMVPHGYEPETVVDTIWKGTGMMVCNDGSCTNETAFWNYFARVYGEDKLNDKPLFETFYATEFQKVAEVCRHTPKAGALIADLKAAGFRVVLATNPLFPAIATESRMRWAGLDPTDFELYTTYENSRRCKPSLAYYQDILDAIGCKAEECVMVGNDVSEDMVAEQLGMKVFLLTDCLINKHDKDVSCYPNGDFDALSAYLMSVNKE